MSIEWIKEPFFSEEKKKKIVTLVPFFWFHSFSASFRAEQGCTQAVNVNDEADNAPLSFKFHYI